jgi:hypothetical protein
MSLTAASTIGSSYFANDKRRLVGEKSALELSGERGRTRLRTVPFWAPRPVRPDYSAPMEFRARRRVPFRQCQPLPALVCRLSQWSAILCSSRASMKSFRPIREFQCFPTVVHQVKAGVVLRRDRLALLAPERFGKLP